MGIKIRQRLQSKKILTGSNQENSWLFRHKASKGTETVSRQTENNA